MRAVKIERPTKGLYTANNQHKIIDENLTIQGWVQEIVERGQIQM